MSLLTLFRSRKSNTSPHPTRTRLGVQQLEAREVPAVSLLSALGTGDPTGVGSSQARDVAVDAAGNTYLAGSFAGATDFDPANDRLGGADVLTARGSHDGFVAKYDPDGALAWVRRMGGDAPNNSTGTVTDIAEDVYVDTAGNVFVTGRFYGTADFGPFTRTAAGDADGFVARLSSTGTVQWANRWGGALEDWGKGLGVDAAGNVYVLGGRTDNATTVALVDDQHGLDVLKFSPTGGSVWTKWVNTRYIPGWADVAVSPTGNVYVAGSFAGTVDFDPGTGRKEVKTVYSGPSNSGFVLSLTAAGAFGWVSPFVGQYVDASSYGSSVAQSITLDGSGSVVVGGRYVGPVDFNPGSGTTVLPGRGGFVAKLTATGALTWARALEGDTVFVYGLAVDAAGGIYATGAYYGATDFDPGAGVDSRTPVGSQDVFVLKLDAAGTYQWAEAFGGAADDIGFGIAVDPSGTVSLAGRYSGTVDVDPDPLGTYELTTPGAKNNLFLVKLRQS